MADAVDAAAVKFPETPFALLGVPHDALEHRPNNVQGIVFSEAEAGYLAGYLAARMAGLQPGDQVIGAIGGERVPAVEHFIAGYDAGARRANPDVTVLTSYTDDFIDPAKGRTAALSQIANGSRVVFQVASSCGLGVLQAAQEQGVWGIGVDADESYLGPHVLTSALTRLDTAVLETIRELLRGTFGTGGTSVFSLRNGGVGLGEISPEVPGAVLTELESIRSQIVAGAITVPAEVR
jgi:basic membrane protein A